MAYNNKKKKSFFQEQRDYYVNANFFNNMDIIVLRNSVKRIIRDIANDIILDRDYVYFTNPRVIQACLQESFEQFQTCQTLRHALSSYRTIILPNHMVSPDIDINLDYILAAEELSKISMKENIWATANKLFNDVYNGADPKSTLIYLSRFPRQSINSL